MEALSVATQEDEKEEEEQVVEETRVEVPGVIPETSHAREVSAIIREHFAKIRLQRLPE
jgi:hypothetical protein